MKKAYYFFFAILFCTSIAFSQTIGEYRSKNTGNWQLVSNWETWNGSAWVNSTSYPSDPGAIVTIKSGHEINTGGFSPAIYDLEIEFGAKLHYVMTGTSYILLYHNIICNGQLGDYDIYLNIAGADCNITGSGQILLTQIRKTTTTYTSNLHIYSNISFQNDFFCIYNNFSGSIFNLTIEPNSSLLINTGSTTLAGNTNNPGFTTNIDVYGVLNTSKLYISNNNITNLSYCTIHSGGTIITKEIVCPASSTGTTFTIVNGGTLQIVGNTAFSNPFSNVNNTFNLNGTVEYISNGAQNIQPLNYMHLKLGGSGIKTFVGGVSNILANGSLDLSGTSTPVGYTFGSGASLNVSSTNTTLIYSAGNAQATANEFTDYTFANLKVNKTSDLTINSSKSFTGNLNMQSGKIFLGNNNLSFGSISGGSSSSYVVTNGTGNLSSTVGTSPNIFPIGENTSSYNPITLTNNGNADVFTVRCSTSTSGAVNETGVINKQWTIIENLGGESSLLLTAQWNSDDEQGSFVRSSAAVGIRAGDNFDIIPGGSCSGTEPGPYSISTTAPLTVNLSGGKIITVGNPSALPVELGAFHCHSKNNTIVLDWETLTEKNSLGFEIERKTDSSEWTKIGFVRGYCLSNSPKYYSFTDENISCGKYFYRLKMIDVDGYYEYSKIISIDITVPKRFLLLQNYPNPFNPSTIIKYSVPEGIHHILLKVYDILGNEIKTVINQEQSSGIYEVEVDMHEYPAGTYFYSLSSDNFTQVKKLLLLK